MSNKGLPITAAKARTLGKKRGERADQAILGDQEGSGLGLYLINKIMEAHHGRLEINHVGAKPDEHLHRRLARDTASNVAFAGEETLVLRP